MTKYHKRRTVLISDHQGFTNGYKRIALGILVVLEPFSMLTLVVDTQITRLYKNFTHSNTSETRET